ncbi:MAG: C15orf41 family protein [archaeon]|nr:C15orf41 family protein [archaeon]
MEYGEYQRLYKGLNTPEDLQAFLDEGYDKNLLETLYNQKVNRTVKKKYHIVKKNSARILRMWKRGKSICEIADEYGFPPILTAMMIFQEDGCGKKIFWEYVRDPSLLDSEETAAELREASERDLVYSIEGNERSKERGQWGEGLLWKWLDDQGVTYKTEADERQEDGQQGSKTPDCLLDEPMDFCGKKIYWIESKASFGDATEFKFNSTKQLIPYTELFGPGVVVYWTGHLDGLECPKNIILEDIGILEKSLKKWNKE